MSKTSKEEEEAARLLFNAASNAQHQFDQTTRRDALVRIRDAIKAGLTPKDAAFGVASVFLLNPSWDGETLVIAP
jgi:hypothetical protein